MENSVLLFKLFYNKIRTDIVFYLQTNPNKQDYSIFVETIATTIFKEKIPRTNYASEIIQMIDNNLTVYLEMLQFIREHQKPFMINCIDAMHILDVFNRFYYLYALHMMKHECIFSSDIQKIIQTYLV
jgi:hypothetical protein